MRQNARSSSPLPSTGLSISQVFLAFKQIHSNSSTEFYFSLLFLSFFFLYSCSMRTFLNGHKLKCSPFARSNERQSISFKLNAPWRRQWAYKLSRYIYIYIDIWYINVQFSLMAICKHIGKCNETLHWSLSSSSSSLCPIDSSPIHASLSLFFFIFTSQSHANGWLSLAAATR